MINKKSLNGIYEFMSNVYEGNWSYRWSGTPHMINSLSKNKRESILAHQLACIGFWFNLRRICPNLSKLVDSTKIYEIFWGHDLGEIFTGDVSQTMQVKGYGLNKKKVERQEIIKMSKKAPKEISKILLHNFDLYENDYEKINSLEILVCKLIDNMQGNHFAIVFGNDFKIHSNLISKIVNRSLIRAARQLLKVLKQKRNKKAHKEAELLIEHHLGVIKKSGTKLKLEKYQ
jgi:5'-deoxynucleotidase YfbR-like HD superfamily hydrolase